MDVAPDVAMIDTMLGGWRGITAAYLLGGTSPALVETGAETSAGAVIGELAARGVEADDLAWIVLTHIHLDHCGAVGELARAFPRATIVVHRRGARHLADPERLVTASAQVYGDLTPLYGGLRAVPSDRILAVEGGARISLGGTRGLTVIDAPGHARHHVALLDDSTGTVFAGDALGVQFAGSGLYPAVPPPDFDLDRAVETLRALSAVDPQTLLLGHFGPVPDPAAALAESERLQHAAAAAARRGWAAGGFEGVRDAIQAEIPLEEHVTDEPALERWRMLRWTANNVAGLSRWAAAQQELEAAASSDSG